MKNFKVIQKIYSESPKAPLFSFPKKGTAIVIALFFAFCLMIAALSLFKSSRNVVARNRVSLQSQQAFFAARAALQHFLLKAKLFPTELYDAVEFTQGKNPLFDFSEFSSSAPGFQKFGDAWINDKDPKDVNKCIKYYYFPISADAPNSLIKLGSFYNPSYRFLGGEKVPGREFTARKLTTEKGDKFLSYYILDCANKVEKNKTIRIAQPKLVTDRSKKVKTAKDFHVACGGSYPNDNEFDNDFPYTMSYEVKKIEIQAMKELRRYNEEAILIQVVGNIEDFQGKKYSQLQEKVQKIVRTGTPQ